MYTLLLVLESDFAFIFEQHRQYQQQFERKKIGDDVLDSKWIWTFENLTSFNFQSNSSPDGQANHTYTYMCVYVCI